MKSFLRQLGCVLNNLLLIYICYSLCRVIFTLDNWDTFNYLSLSDFMRLSVGGLLFDTSAIAYSNILYILLVFFPLHIKEREGYYRFTKWVFVVINMLMLAMNLMDSAYFPFSNQRTTTSIFAQFSNEDNLVGIFAVEALRSWYLVVAFALMAAVVWKCYRTPVADTRNKAAYYPLSLLLMVIFAGACLL